ncbi:MAG TPA: transglycosylase domain-containing protein [Methylobacter sp.]
MDLAFMSKVRVSSLLKIMAAGVVAVPVLGLLIWYMASFIPYLGELKSLAEQGVKIKKDANPAFYSIAVAGETTNRIRSYAFRQAYWSLVAEKGNSGMLSWHLNNVLWRVASHLHFNKEETFGIWVECSLYGCGRGLEEASQKFFGKAINTLSEDELAGLVALVKSPSIYAPGTLRGQDRKRMILENTMRTREPGSI